MKTLHVATLFVALLGAACGTSCTRTLSSPAPVTVPPGAVQSAVDATVIVLDVENGSLCAGVHLGNGAILTAAHCVDSGYAEIRGRDGEVWEYYAQKLDEGLDLALIRAIDIAYSGPHLSVARCAPDYGDHVVAVGHPTGLMFTATAGIVSHPRRHPSGYPGLFVQVDAIAWPGNSGGPLVDARGSLVGIASMLPVAGMPYFVHTDTIRAFLRMEDSC